MFFVFPNTIVQALREQVTMEGDIDDYDDVDVEYNINTNMDSNDIYADDTNTNNNSSSSKGKASTIISQLKLQLRGANLAIQTRQQLHENDIKV